MWKICDINLLPVLFSATQHFVFISDKVASSKVYCSLKKKMCFTKLLFTRKNCQDCFFFQGATISHAPRKLNDNLKIDSG